MEFVSGNYDIPNTYNIWKNKTHIPTTKQKMSVHSLRTTSSNLLVVSAKTWLDICFWRVQGLA